MDKGDLFTVYLDGVQMTVCIVNIYKEEPSGRDVAVLAVIDQDNLIHIPVSDLKAFFASKQWAN
ncbi:MAG TPA: hypothetical protein GXX39_03630 [Syntrophothermus lipocalidus]|uniref:Uncharacterized protein n=1 Tax=Syntrophothermus lipocalidus (strain DSM 12680 / TGB-C1) TaxID=643648 RepID=D7CP99_SYNLT|nr:MULTISPECIES: hypothetical protein [Syntrophothermus]ADI02534.1 conserved hypothetical protein [Syntrophothermus lipocalidus DSM 12680]NSW83463.1 hypothetical protein [Syntrophothermus sp.]HHV76449.1 hypothetical protein [Syntrophothermus lipocalidus]HOV43038.1 hypothetical protein [Syntrophothermus lipocalidus]